MPSSMIPQHFHLSQRSIKTRFAYRFLRALKKLNKPRTTTTTITSSTSSYAAGYKRRYHMVKTAAYASMAAAVGSKRAWSRALLWKIRKRGRTAAVVMKRNCKAAPHGGRRGSSSLSLMSSKKTSIKILENPSKAGELQKLVPGGEVMDYCSLLDETAHYIKCLTSQVQIMRSIADFYSSA